VIPVLNEIQLSPNIIGKEERLFPIDFEGIYSEQAQIKIELPQTLKVKYLPHDINLENQWFAFDYAYQQDSDGLTVNQSFFVKKRFVQSRDYKDFKRELENVFYFLREEIILEKNED
ncbi:MAG: hypothetical protein ABIH71_02780, partial [Candidatus Omnitrophota bacterium]